MDELNIHLENKFYLNPNTGETMSWENYGRYGWYIDHMIPLAAFDLKDESQILRARHYTNLQPLLVEDNLSKGSKLVIT